MLTQAPSFVQESGVVGAPIKYKWNSDLAMDLDDVENDRLYDAINASSFRAKMAIGSMLAEWIAWRLRGHADTTDALLRAEAAWAGVIDPMYVTGLDFKGSADDDVEKAKAPLESALSHLADAWSEYAGGSIYLAEPVMKLGVLARHLSPDKKVFDDWLSATLRRTAKEFPRGEEYDEDSETYDASGEVAVPRAFFEPKFKYTDATAKSANADFLQSAAVGKNPYLRSASAMKSAGFKGKPYSA